MKRPKKIKGLCGKYFIQSQYTREGHISLDCPEMYITCDIDVAKIECLKLCEECERKKDELKADCF